MLVLFGNLSVNRPKMSRLLPTTFSKPFFSEGGPTNVHARLKTPRMPEVKCPLAKDTLALNQVCKIELSHAPAAFLLYIETMTCVCVHVRLDRPLCEIKGLFPTQQEQAAQRRREGDLRGHYQIDR